MYALIGVLLTLTENRRERMYVIGLRYRVTFKLRKGSHARHNLFACRFYHPQPVRRDASDTEGCALPHCIRVHLCEVALQHGLVAHAAGIYSIDCQAYGNEARSYLANNSRSK